MASGEHRDQKLFDDLFLAYDDVGQLRSDPVVGADQFLHQGDVIRGRPLDRFGR